MRRAATSSTFLTATLALLLTLAGPASAATLSASPNPATGPLPKVITLSGSGYTPGGDKVLITASPLSGPATNILVAECKSDPSGNLTGTVAASSCQFTVGSSAADMSAFGGYVLTATQGPNIGTYNFNVATSNGVPPTNPEISFSPNPFTAADTVTFTGCGYQVLGNANSLDLYLADGPRSPGKYALATEIAVTPDVTSGCPKGGSWSASLVMPGKIPTGSYYVNTYRAGNMASVASLVEASTNYTLSWTQPGAAPATPVSASPNYTG